MGNFQMLSDEKIDPQAGEKSSGGVRRFYCPHCHRFDGEGLMISIEGIRKQKSKRSWSVSVIPGKLPTAFDMYEQAKTMGKGNEMKRALFRTIHKDKIGIIDKAIREVC